MPPSDPSVGTTHPSPSPSISSHEYHETYLLRRRRSTMADDVRTWLCNTAPTWCDNRAEGSGPLRILSLGCGDGNLDLPLLDTLMASTAVDYVGVDVNTTSLASFRAALTTRVGSKLSATLLDTPAESLTPDGRPFDVVLLSHMLYYLKRPGALVSRLVRQFTATDGQVIIVQSSHKGVPALMVAGELQPFTTAEDVASTLGGFGLTPIWHTLQGELDATDLLADTPEGRAVLAFCLETDLETMAPDALTRVHDELRARCSPRDGRLIFPEDVAVLTLRAPLREVVLGQRPAVKVDPLDDYHQLADAFAWPERLQTLPVSADGRHHLLDVGCGTGRWLRVLRATFPELHGGAARHVHYSALDPVAEAVDAARAEAANMFTLDRSWVTSVQDADLPPTHFGLIWAVHSLYGVPTSDLPAALEHLLAALHPDGTALLILPDRQSFYIEAAVQLLGETVFTSADDVRAVLDATGRRYQVRRVLYEERIPVTDDAALRHYVWMESIGNTYLPGGQRDDLPPLPSGPWWEGLRRGDVVAFPQNVEVIAIAGTR